jgi:hypothetical protein
MLKRIPRPTPALGVALVALFVALGGTATAGVIVTHAKLADNATKLQGKTPAQVAGLAQPPASLAGYVTVKTASWSVGAGSYGDFTVTCDAGQKAIAGGFDNPAGPGLALDTRPTPDGSGWHVIIVTMSDTAGASGSVYAVCLK